jgi:transcriptional regulator with XRE-family HTH domain
MKLRDYRIKLGLSQQMVAESLGVDQSSVSRYEDGLIPSLDIMRRIDEWSGGRVGPLDFYDFWRGPDV